MYNTYQYFSVKYNLIVTVIFSNIYLMLKSFVKVCSSGSLRQLYFPSGFKNELKCLLTLFFPCFFTTIFRFLNPLISLIMCGHLSKLEFDAASLAYSIINIFGENIDLGFSTAFDTLFSQMYGSGQKKKMGILLQRAIIVMIIIYLVLICFHLNIEPILIFLKQDPLVSELTARYITFYLPGLFFDFQFLAFSRYLQNQNIVYPMVISALISNIFNIICQYVLIFIYGFGITVSASILSTSNFLMFSLQLGYILISKIYKDSWDGFSLRESLKHWKILFLLGLPGILMFSLKEWIFEISIFIAGSFDGVQLGAQSVAFQCITIGFTMTVGLGLSVNIRVGEYLGARNIDRLKTFLRTAALVGISFSLLCFTLIFVLRKQIAILFTNDVDIQIEASNLLLYASFFQLIDTFLVIFSGILKASGRQFIGAYTMFLCHYIIGLPIGILLIYGAKLDIRGMWIGLIVATSIEGLIFGIVIYRTKWDVECDKASKNTEQFKNTETKHLEMKQIMEISTVEERFHSTTESIYSKNSKKDESNKINDFKIILIKRSLTITAVLSLVLVSLMIRLYLPKTLHQPINNQTKRTI